MSLFKQFATDANKETDGVKIEFSPNADGSIPSITVARMGKSNKRYAKALEVATRPYRRQIELGTLDNEVAEKLFQKVFADTIVKAWENIKDEVEVAIPFNKENALKLFEKLPEFYEEVQKQANSVANFRNDSMENDAKN